MTTGSNIVGNTYTNGLYKGRVWDGADGKYSIVGGVQVPRYNNYNNKTWSVRTVYPKTSSGAWYAVSIAGTPTFASIFTSSYAVKNQNKLVSKVKDFDFNLAVAGAEMGLTIGMTVGAIQSMVKSIRALKRGDFATAAQSLGANKHTSKLGQKDLTGRWLELQYGWLPLLSDVYGASQALALKANAPRQMRWKATTTATGKYDGSQSPSLYSGLGVAKASQTIIYEATEVLTTKRQLGLEDPLTLAWEVIPYSFVVDWFIPIGSYLENLNIIPQLKGTFIVSEHMSGINRYKDKVLSSYGITGGSGDGEFTYHKRTVSNSMNAFGVARPGFIPIEKALSPLHVTNAIALLSQAFSGFPSPLRHVNRGSIL